MRTREIRHAVFSPAFAGDEPVPLGHATARASAWRWAIGLILVVSAARLAYLIWLTPYQLVGDEACYWVESKHPALCYYEKGPALPWMIRACCGVFGDVEWAVRLPVVLAFALAAWGVGRLAMSIAGGDKRAGFYAVACFCLLPAYHANAQICTQDGPLIALWVGLTAVGLRLVRRWGSGANTWPEWLGLWGLLGVSFLLKQSAVLFMLAVPVYWWVQRRRLRLTPVLVAQQVVGIAVFLAVISPMILWNQRHGWVTLGHTLGHLGAGGDQAGKANKGNPLIWVASTVGAVVGAVGPACLLLMILASAGWWGREEEPDGRVGRIWLVCAAWPSVVFFGLLSLTKPVLANWPLPSFVPLVALVGAAAARELPRYRSLLAGWRGERRHAQAAGRKPETAFHRWWSVMVVYGVVGCALVSFPNVLGRLPVVGPRLERSVLQRFSGNRQEAEALHSVLSRVSVPDGRPPVIVTQHYMEASLLWFYLPGHPRVYTAGKYLGRRTSSFDEWADTDLANPALEGRWLVLVGDPGTDWERVFKFDSRVRLDARVWLAAKFEGLKANALVTRRPGPADSKVVGGVAGAGY